MFGILVELITICVFLTEHNRTVAEKEEEERVLLSQRSEPLKLNYKKSRFYFRPFRDLFPSDFTPIIAKDSKAVHLNCQIFILNAPRTKNHSLDLK